MTAVSSDLTVICWRMSLDIKDGGGLRVQAYLDALCDMHVAVNLVPVGPTLRDLQSVGVDSRLHSLKRAHLPVPLQRTATRELSEPPTSDRVALSMVPAAHGWTISHHAVTWLDYFDLWSAFSGGHTRSPLAVATRRAQRTVWRRREKSHSRTADVITCAAAADADAMGPSARHIPTPVVARDLIATARRTTGRGDGLTVGFLANFDYAPNRAGYDLLVKSWLPRLRASGVDEVVVAGFGSQNLPDDPAIVNIGPVETVADFYDRIDAALTPIPFGGGMKVKVVEALAFGVPVVASDHALVGLPDPIADACVRWETLVRRPGSSSLRDLIDRSPRPDLSAFTHERFAESVHAVWQVLQTPMSALR